MGQQSTFNLLLETKSSDKASIRQLSNSPAFFSMSSSDFVVSPISCIDFIASSPLNLTPSVNF